MVHVHQLHIDCARRKNTLLLLDELPDNDDRLQQQLPNKEQYYHYIYTKTNEIQTVARYTSAHKACTNEM